VPAAIKAPALKKPPALKKTARKVMDHAGGFL
jgi:hypothetical protein